MKQKENFIVHVRYNELDEIQAPISEEYDTFTGIYILTKDSFLNYPNFDIQNLLNNDYIKRIYSYLLLTKKKLFNYKIVI